MIKSNFQLGIPANMTHYRIIPDTTSSTSMTAKSVTKVGEFPVEIHHEEASAGTSKHGLWFVRCSILLAIAVFMILSWRLM
jgi:hypothetical protein